MSLIFNQEALIVYCDPKIHGQETYERVLEALCKACHEYNSRDTTQENPLVFVISNRKDLQVMQFPDGKGP
jgi:hypothetical protein